MVHTIPEFLKNMKDTLISIIFWIGLVSNFALVHSNEGAFTRSQTRENGKMVIKNSGLIMVDMAKKD